MHQLQVHEVGFKVGHGVAELSEGRLEGLEWKGMVAAADAAGGECLAVAEGGAGGGAERSGGSGWGFCSCARCGSFGI